jgi:hypothetical protein
MAVAGQHTCPCAMLAGMVVFGCVFQHAVALALSVGHVIDWTVSTFPLTSAVGYPQLPCTKPLHRRQAKVGLPCSRVSCDGSIPRGQFRQVGYILAGVYHTKVRTEDLLL